MVAFTRRHHSFILLATLVVVVAGILVPFAFVEAQNVAPGTLTLQSPVGAAVNGKDEGGGLWDIIIGYVMRPFVWAFRALAGFFMLLSSWILDKSLEYSLTRSLDSYIGIQIGWQVMRDFANLFFIFVILYIAIKTILQLSTHNTRQMLVRVIVVALLINFSAFFTKVVIDVGNVLAVGFYNRIILSDAPGTNSPNCTENNVQSPCTIGKRFKQAMDIQMLVARDPNGPNGEPSAIQISMLYLMTGILYMMAGMIFLKAAFYFIARMIAFAFLIMFSPIAFLSYAVPNSMASSFMSKWWSKLFGYTILAPAFMIIMYLVFQIISAGGFITQAQDSISTVVNMLLAMGLIYGGTNIAFGFADSAGHMIGKFGGTVGRVAGGAALGAGTAALAYGSRQTLGRWMGENRVTGRSGQKLDARIAKGGVMGRLAELRKGAYEKIAKSSFDVAQSKTGARAMGAMGAEVPGILQRGQGGLRSTGRMENVWRGRGKTTKAQEEAEVKKAKELFPDDPKLQQEYLTNRLGRSKVAGKLASNFETSETKAVKDARGEIKSKIETEQYVKNIENAVEKATSLGWTKEKEAELRKAVEDGNTAIISSLSGELKTVLSSVGDDVRTSLRRLSPKGVAGMKQELLGSMLVGANLTGSELSEIHRADRDGKYTDQVMIQAVGQNVYASSNSKGSEYLASPEGRKNLFNYQIPRDQVRGTKVYLQKVRRSRKLTNRIAELNMDISTHPTATTTDKDRIAKLQEELDKKTSELENVREDLSMMRS